MAGIKMFIVKVLDTSETDYYNKIEDVYMNCEGIDVNNGLYEFSDDEGIFMMSYGLKR